MDLYAVFGNPIAHSRSPWIHARFAAQTGEALSYEAILAPTDGFAAAVAAFRARGGRGANVTVPFKLDAFALADRRSERAEAAGAANTLIFSADGVLADNTDGAGLVRDLAFQGCALSGQRVLLLGAGGAARGALLPLLAEKPGRLVVANRTAARATALIAGRDCGATELAACGFDDLAGSSFNVVINATSSSLAGEAPPLPRGIYAPDSLAYDMMYGRDETAFLSAARELGAAHCLDGLGMLIEQAAESFFLWRALRPDTGAVRRDLRTLLAS
ncbi:shikimate dehydrogenase [Niveibacterium terrae]|uniref:shikimate dehydrogenase n=1 Tax=Niveibacterium terrae TaxID=3373598 RepID=UPI003A8E1493